MSDGMSDKAALNSLTGKLSEAAFELRDAIVAADKGHRGTSIVVEETVNKILKATGYELRMTLDHWGMRGMKR